MAAWRQAISKNIREIRIHLCQTSPRSQGVREFIEGNYVDLKKSNPKLPILIRECSGVRPVMFARYDRGVEKKADLQSLSSEQVTQALEKLVLEPPPQKS